MIRTEAKGNVVCSFRLHVDEELESGIGFAAVFAEVEAAEFFLLADADAGGFLQCEEDREGGHEGHRADDDRADELRQEFVVRREDADRVEQQNEQGDLAENDVADDTFEFRHDIAPNDVYCSHTIS